MISSKNLLKLLVSDFFPKCKECVHYKHGLVIDGICGIYKDILSARIDPTKCTLEGKDFKINKNKKK